jgi:putative two-component system response regulator
VREIANPPPSTLVLLVDNDAAFRRSSARLLADHGYACLEAANSTEALDVLGTEPNIAAVLCDIQMPTVSGIDLLPQLTKDYPDVAVVMTTVVDDPTVATLAFDLGAFGYVIKPFDDNELLVNLAGALRRRDLESAQRQHVDALEQTIARTVMLGKVVDELDVSSRVTLISDEEVIERLSRALSLRDEETGQHIERMSRFCVVLADAVGFTDLPPEAIRLATALHDVGKIGVPDVVLLKPGSLSAEERLSMQRHAQIGYQLLRDSKSDLLRTGADIALSHHEWWDGGGYPRGLQGAEIPEMARIAAIADVFDALTSDRVYRPSLPLDESTAIMGELRGRQFEPRLLDAFFGSMDEISAIREAYPEQESTYERIRVLVVDDHAIFAQSLVRLLGSRPEIKVVGTAGNVTEAVASASAYQPDVVLMDFELPDGNGLQATEQIKAMTPSVKVIMLTVHADDQSLVDAISAGCSGFVKKQDAVDDLFAAIVAAHDGEMILPPSDLTHLLRQLRPTRRGLGSSLTTRQHEVLGLMASGLVNKQIAKRLGLSLNTVRNHTQNILYKLQAHSKLEAVATATREGIIDTHFAG